MCVLMQFTIGPLSLGFTIYYGILSKEKMMYIIIWHLKNFEAQEKLMDNQEMKILK